MDRTGVLLVPCMLDIEGVQMEGFRVRCRCLLFCSLYFFVFS